jgi:hypothetical protein
VNWADPFILGVLVYSAIMLTWIHVRLVDILLELRRGR